MNNESPFLQPILYEKIDNGACKRVSLIRMQDNSAYIEGDEEIIFDYKKDGWRTALKYLDEHGYRRMT